MRLSSLLVLFALCGATAAQAQTPASRALAKDTLSSTQAKSTLAVPSQRVVQALWRGDTKTLARYIHPQHGIPFSPYVFLDAKEARKWSRGEVARLGNSKTIYNWGQYDAGEDSIHLTWNGFRRKFLSPRDFSKAQVVFQSQRSHGNTIDNLRSLYPDGTLVEYYVPGTSKYGGMDWHALWLVWRPINANWYLVAIAGDRWTT